MKKITSVKVDNVDIAEIRNKYTSTLGIVKEIKVDRLDGIRITIHDTENKLSTTFIFNDTHDFWGVCDNSIIMGIIKTIGTMNRIMCRIKNGADIKKETISYPSKYININTLEEKGPLQITYVNGTLCLKLGDYNYSDPTEFASTWSASI